MADEIIFRKDVPQNLTWDISLIYETEEDMYRDAQEMEGKRPITGRIV